MRRWDAYVSNTNSAQQLTRVWFCSTIAISRRGIAMAVPFNVCANTLFSSDDAESPSDNVMFSLLA